MPECEKIQSVAREWVQKAENDLKAAAQILKLADDCPTDTVCFHAQQSVEKYVKALPTMSGTDFPKTHDLDRPYCAAALKEEAADQHCGAAETHRICDGSEKSGLGRHLVDRGQASGGARPASS